MESNLSTGNMLSGGPGFGGFDLQGSMNNEQTRRGLIPHLSGNEVFGLTMGQNHGCESNRAGRANNLPSDEEENNFNNEEGMDGHSDAIDGGKKVPCWQRVKWADSMVRLLITAVSYLGEDAVIESGVFGRRKLSALHKKGKWKLASKVMGERGFYVSPQQCEDKFNDLNKRYKKLNDILGRGTSCQVVEKPSLLDIMDNLSDKTKDDVRKILGSKQLFYEEMCSYHNNNRLHLPHDPALQRSIQLALRSRDDYDTDSRTHHHDDADDDHDHDAETDDYEEYEENRSPGAFVACGDSSKRMKTGPILEEFNFGDPHSFKDFNKGLELHSQTDMHLSLPEGEKASLMNKHWFKLRSLELEEKKLQLESEMLELEKQRFKWERFSKKKDQELEQLKMENDRMKLENESKALELKRMEMSINCSK